MSVQTGYRHNITNQMNDNGVFEHFSVKLWKKKPCIQQYMHFFLSILYFKIITIENNTGATSGAGTAYPSGAPEFTPGY